MNESIQAITKLWTKFAPHQPFRYSFLDERYAAMYIDVQRTGQIFTSFAGSPSKVRHYRGATNLIP